MTEPVSLCTVCRRAAARYANRGFLGSQDALCWWCFLLWYDEGVTSRDEMQSRRMIDQFEGKP